MGAHVGMTAPLCAASMLPLMTDRFAVPETAQPENCLEVSPMAPLYFIRIRLHRSRRWERAIRSRSAASLPQAQVVIAGQWLVSDEKHGVAISPRDLIPWRTVWLRHCSLATSILAIYFNGLNSLAGVRLDRRKLTHSLAMGIAET